MTTAAANTRYTLLDHLRRLNPKGGIDDIVEEVMLESPVMQHAYFKEGNLLTGERYTSRTGLPVPTYREYNRGDDPTKSETTQFDEPCARLGDRSEADVELCKLGGEPEKARMAEEKPHVAGLLHEFDRAFFYNSLADGSNRFNGLAQRLASTSGRGGDQVVLHTAGAAGNEQASVYFVQHGPEGVYCIYPKGSKAGWEQIDMGVQLVEDANGKKFRAYVTDWEWKVGLVVKSFKAVVRVANIDMGSLAVTDDSLAPAFIDAKWRLGNPSKKTDIYVPRDLMAMWEKQQRNTMKSSVISWDTFGGKLVPHFQGMQIHVSDHLLVTEAPIS